LAVVAVTAFKRKYEDRFMDYGVYFIQNREYAGVLTFVNETDANGFPIWKAPIIYEFNSNSSAQRWRLDEAALYTAFEIRPTKNENYVLEYVPETGIISWLTHWGNTKLWYLLDAGDEHTMIKHKRYDICLEATGNHAPVVGVNCVGKPSQQWMFKNVDAPAA
ncbi:hypothetical protein Fcan01_12913, partial [Folsomia candida]